MTQIAGRFVCKVCGFNRTHRYASGGIDQYWAILRVALHIFLKGHFRKF